MAPNRKQLSVLMPAQWISVCCHNACSPIRKIQSSIGFELTFGSGKIHSSLSYQNGKFQKWEQWWLRLISNKRMKMKSFMRQRFIANLKTKKKRQIDNREIIHWILSIKWRKRRKNWEMSINAIAKLLSNCDQTWYFRNPLRCMTFHRMHERTLNILKNIHNSRFTSMDAGCQDAVCTMFIALTHTHTHMCCELSNQVFCICFLIAILSNDKCVREICIHVKHMFTIEFRIRVFIHQVHKRWIVSLWRKRNRRRKTWKRTMFTFFERKGKSLNENMRKTQKRDWSMEFCLDLCVWLWFGTMDPNDSFVSFRWGAYDSDRSS